MTVHVGDRVVPGTEIRKKVLSLLTFLLTRPQFTASREQVVEAPWPQDGTGSGANSLNQTCVLPRRVFEPATTEDASAGYLNSRADLIWLDPELVAQQELGVPEPHRGDPPRSIARARRQARRVLHGPLRGRLHLRRLGVSLPGHSARELPGSNRAGRCRRHQGGCLRPGPSVAQLALQADPDAEQIELCLLRLYRQRAPTPRRPSSTRITPPSCASIGGKPPPLDSI